MRWSRSSSVLVLIFILLVGDAYSGDDTSSLHQYFPSRFWPYLRDTQRLCINSKELGNNLGDMCAILTSMDCDALYIPFDYDSENALRHLMDVTEKGIYASHALIHDLSNCKPADCLKLYHGYLMSSFQTINDFYNYLNNSLNASKCASVDSCNWYSRRMNGYIDDATASFLDAREKCKKRKSN